MNVQVLVKVFSNKPYKNITSALDHLEIKLGCTRKNVLKVVGMHSFLNIVEIKL